VLRLDRWCDFAGWIPPDGRWIPALTCVHARLRRRTLA